MVLLRRVATATSLVKKKAIDNALAVAEGLCDHNDDGGSGTTAGER